MLMYTYIKIVSILMARIQGLVVIWSPYKYWYFNNNYHCQNLIWSILKKFHSSTICGFLHTKGNGPNDLIDYPQFKTYFVTPKLCVFNDFYGTDSAYCPTFKIAYASTRLHFPQVPFKIHGCTYPKITKSGVSAVGPFKL